MVLPLLLGMAGSGLASAGMLGAMSPLLAASLGSGIGAFAETGDIKNALTTGLASGITGGMLGGQVAGAAGNLAGAGGQMAGNAAAQGAQGAVQQAAGQVANNTAANAVMQGAGANMTGLPQAAGNGLFSNVGGTGSTGIANLLGRDAIKGYTGALVGQAMQPMASNGKGDMKERSDRLQREYPQMPAPGRSLTRSPLMDREFDYKVQPNYTRAGMTNGVMQMQDGGIAQLGAPQMNNDQVAGRNAKQVVSDAIAAISGQHPSPEQALGAFLAMFGEEKLRALIKDVKSGSSAERRAQSAGLVNGPEGGGDLVPANIDGQQDVLLEDGEFIMPRDAVSNLGGGDTQMGGERMAQMMQALETAGPMDDKQAKRAMAT